MLNIPESLPTMLCAPYKLRNQRSRRVFAGASSPTAARPDRRFAGEGVPNLFKFKRDGVLCRDGDGMLHFETRPLTLSRQSGRL